MSGPARARGRAGETNRPATGHGAHRGVGNARRGTAFARWPALVDGLPRVLARAELTPNGWSNRRGKARK
jgi:hypothetical protein